MQPAVMPVDPVMCLSLSRRQLLHQLLFPSFSNGMQHQPTEGLHSPRYSSFSPPAPSASPSNAFSRPKSCFRRIGPGLNKKRVMFADAKGLALTAVRLFIPEPVSFDSPVIKTSTDTHLLPTQPQDQQSVSNKQQHYSLRQGLPQLLSDFKALLTHQETSIQLESCDISENSLLGKVCIYHVSIKKTVWIRLTLDSWRSFRDFPCTFLQQLPFAVDVYAFDLRLPKNVDPNERVEFCLFFKAGPGSTPHWDNNNRSEIYSVYLEKDASNVRQGHVNLCRQTSFKQRPPLWPSSELQNLH